MNCLRRMVFMALVVSGFTAQAEAAEGKAKIEPSISVDIPATFRNGACFTDPCKEKQVTLEHLRSFKEKLISNADIRSQSLEESIQKIEIDNTKIDKELSKISDRAVAKQVNEGIKKVLAIRFSTDTMWLTSQARALNLGQSRDPEELRAMFEKYNAVVVYWLQEAERLILETASRLKTLSPASKEYMYLEQVRSEDVMRTLNSVQTGEKVIGLWLQEISEIKVPFDALVPVASLGLVNFDDCEVGALRYTLSALEPDSYNPQLAGITLLPLDGEFLQYLLSGPNGRPMKIRCPKDTWYRVGSKGQSYDKTRHVLTLKSNQPYLEKQVKGIAQTDFDMPISIFREIYESFKAQNVK